MNFCCGASMIGAIGTLKHGYSYIHEVPILYCPVCHKIDVHHLVREEYDILAEYAHADHAPEVYFTDYVDIEHIEDLFADCTDTEDGSIVPVLRFQIDNALDLLSVAKKMGDEGWQNELFNRLKVLSKRLRRYQNHITNQQL